jgi:hypothetical protein
MKTGKELEGSMNREKVFWIAHEKYEASFIGLG